MIPLLILSFAFTASVASATVLFLRRLTRLSFSEFVADEIAESRRVFREIIESRNFGGYINFTE